MLGKYLTIPNCKTIYDKHRPPSTPFPTMVKKKDKMFILILLTLIKILLHPPQRKENDTLHAQTHTHTHERLSPFISIFT